ncbi:hypothetical protein WMY93_014968 [Mugilogobius chulae]|uniref:receptor protein-tyrosine kinase n=1 Tax=Mugilogobius chulae TaxID=88201 RepID=A0AAW0NWW0_9GOBI
MRRLPVQILLWVLICEVWTRSSSSSAEDVELWRWTPQSTWTSVPTGAFVVTPMKQKPVLQGCADGFDKKSFLSEFTNRGDAKHLYLDVTFAQEQEASGGTVPLQVHLLDSRFPSRQTSERWKVLELNASRLFLHNTPPNNLHQFFSNHTALSLGPVTQTGFQLGLSYTGTCVLVSSIRIFYRRCPGLEQDLSSFSAAAGGSESVSGSCVEGAVQEGSRPQRNCSVDGVWGPQQGQCVCAPGHQLVSDSCQACAVGFFRGADATGGCQKCPPHTETHRSGSDRCDCVPGFSRLISDPHDLGCAQPPSAPVNVKAHPLNDSVIILTWDPPLDHGGRPQVSYHVQCETRGQSGGQWKTCEGVFFLHNSSLNSTSVDVSGVNPYEEYRLSVQARNNISTLQGAPLSSTGSVIIQRWRAPPVVVTRADVTHSPRTEAQVTVVSQQQQKNLFLRVTVGVLFGVLLLLILVPVAVCFLQRKYSKLSSEQDVELIPINSGTSYRRPEQETEIPSLQTNSRRGERAAAVGGLGGRLAASLKDVLVERRQLTLGKELGKGEFGSVYEAVFTQEDNLTIKVAVKTMRVGFHTHEDLHEFLREAEIMKNFNHDNVVRLLGVTLQREEVSSVPVPLVILPYMKHGDLRRFLIATRYGDIPMFVPHQTLLRFMVDIAEGMDYLSSQGFLHRDLAARNCMLDDDLRVCVADFGLSRKIYDSNYYRQREAIRVPIKWMAIESLSESVYTTKSDVWSFGITMWEIVSRGRTPYPGVHNHELLDLLLTGYRLKAPADDCDNKLWEVMCKCWEKQPTERPGFRELADRLKALLSELPALEACQEATYINQGLEAAAATDYLIPQSDSGEGKKENVYLPAPVGAAAAPSSPPPQPPREDDMELEEGYLKYISGLEL